MSKDFWNRRVKAPQVKMLEKYITLPAFSADCGFPKYSIVFDGSSVSYLKHTYPGTAMLMSKFTISAWVYCTVGGQQSWPKTIFAVMEESAVDPYISVRVYGGVVNVLLTQGGILNTYPFSIPLPIFQWAHVVISFDKDATGIKQLKCYVNGEEDPISYNTAEAVDPILDQINYIGGTPALPTTFAGRISNVVVYATALKEETIKSSVVMGAFRSPVAAEGDYPDTLQLYQYRLNDNSDTPEETLTGETLTITEVTGSAVEWVEDSPVKFGASFCAAEFAVTATASCSIIYPLQAPTSVNFALLVRYVDDDGNINRRVLFTVDGVELPGEIADYNGERLPSEFVLEIWNVDGDETADLEEDLNVWLSILTSPTMSYDLENLEDNTPVQTTLLAESFPLTFPLTFGVQQTY